MDFGHAVGGRDEMLGRDERGPADLADVLPVVPLTANVQVRLPRPTMFLRSLATDDPRADVVDVRTLIGLLNVRIELAVVLVGETIESLEVFSNHFEILLSDPVVDSVWAHVLIIC